MTGEASARLNHWLETGKGLTVATFVLIHGAGDVGWYWHLVERELRQRGHDTLAPDLPCDDDSAGLPEYANTVARRSAAAAAWSSPPSRSAGSRRRWWQPGFRSTCWSWCPG
jgi:hypothetical protein